MSVKILGIETSCDETAASVVQDGRLLLSNIVSSQVDLHSRYGGIVPEVASRQHVIHIAPTVIEAMDAAGTGFSELSAVAVTFGPGLAGSLLVGLNFAKGLAFSLGIPLIGVNHLEGHIYSAWLLPEGNGSTGSPEQAPGFPLLCLIASGGHTDLVLMDGHGKYRLLGRTRDDAAGEAFDKAARILGLGFPGGPEIQRISGSAQGKEWLPRAWLKGTHDFSFSGLKTALLHKAQAKGLYPAQDPQEEGHDQESAELASAFQESVVDVTVSKTLEAAEKWDARGIILGGGVTANTLLRKRMLEKSTLPTIIPPPNLCTDNGAMIAASGFFLIARGEETAIDLDVDPSLQLG